MIKDIVTQENLKLSNAVSMAKGYMATHKNVIGGKEPVTLKLYGKTTQDGTPTPDAPVDIVGAGENGSLAVVSCGKNLVNYNDFTLEAGSGNYKYQAFTNTNNIKKNKTYTVSFYSDYNNVITIGFMNYNVTATGFIESVKPVNGRYSTVIEVGNDLTNFDTTVLADLFVLSRIATASLTLLPRTRSTTNLALRGEIFIFLTLSKLLNIFLELSTLSSASFVPITSP